ncbi:MAG: TetR/AcrR family transcriptional regulator [Lachnospiraceae bacterium]|nr:TetR/AcrR family transcriptional regulator [Lachnospiraceae bacterium]
MNAKFFDLKQEKQDRIINACLKLFALNGYLHASTDDIVKEAHISKGLLFHYFESKLGAYSFLYDFSVRYYSLELSTAIDPGESSYVEILRQVEAAKMQVMKSYPYMCLFLERCKTEDIAEAVLSIESSRRSFEDTMGTIFARADMTYIYSKANSDRLFNMLEYTLNGTMKTMLTDGSFNAEMLYKENIKYINTVEKALK